MSDILTSFQQDLFGRLSSCTDLASVGVLLQDATSDGKNKSLTDLLNDHLLGIKKTNGRAGLAVLVLMPEVHIQERTQDIPGPQLKLVAAIQVVENEEVNRRDKGTGITAGDLALTILGLMHLFSFGDALLIAETKGITPVGLDDQINGGLAWQVNVMSLLPVEPLAKMIAPMIFATEDGFTLSGAVGAEHWYSLDGSYPRPQAPGSMLYSAAVTLPEGTRLVRAASYAAEFTGSDITQHRVS